MAHLKTIYASAPCGGRVRMSYTPGEGMVEYVRADLVIADGFALTELIAMEYVAFQMWLDRVYAGQVEGGARETSRAAVAVFRKIRCALPIELRGHWLEVEKTVTRNFKDERAEGHPAPSIAVKVKSLIWKDQTDASYGGRWVILHTSFGSPSGAKMWRGKSLGYKRGTTNHLGFMWHVTRESAKAAAQAHHDANLRSQLEGE